MSPSLLAGFHCAGIITGRMRRAVYIPPSGPAIDIWGNVKSWRGGTVMRKVLLPTLNGIKMRRSKWDIDVR